MKSNKDKCHLLLNSSKPGQKVFLNSQISHHINTYNFIECKTKHLFGKKPIFYPINKD